MKRGGKAKEMTPVWSTIIQYGLAAFVGGLSGLAFQLGN
jgi:hypothetical protein